MTHLVRAGSLHGGPGYFPVAVAYELGLFADQELDVVFSEPRHGPHATTALLNGETDVVLGGIWRPITYRGRLGTLRAFAQVCAKCYLVLLSRTRTEAFTLADLVGKTIVVPSLTPASSVFLAGVLTRHGIDPEQVKLVRDFNPDEATSLYRNGMGDFLVAMPELALQLVEQGAASLAFHLADAGEVPWSVYYSTPTFLALDNGEPAARFAKALDNALSWIDVSRPCDRALLARKHYGNRHEAAVVLIEECVDKGLWNSSALIPEEPLDWWQDTMIANGWIAGRIPYASLVDTGIAQALAESHFRSTDG